jgi:hypothetical protein
MVEGQRHGAALMNFPLWDYDRPSNSRDFWWVEMLFFVWARIESRKSA